MPLHELAALGAAACWAVTGILSQAAAQALGPFGFNRLRQGMRLQCDPTTIYGLGPDFDGDLKRAHLEDARNPYNTYAHAGLPPGPSALVVANSHLSGMRSRPA